MFPGFMKKYTRVFLSSAFLVAVSYLAYDWYCGVVNITQARCDRIKVGMTGREVVAVLKRCPDECISFNVVAKKVGYMDGNYTWYGCSGDIRVGLQRGYGEKEHTVTGATFNPHPEMSVGWLLIRRGIVFENGLVLAASISLFTLIVMVFIRPHYALMSAVLCLVSLMILWVCYGGAMAFICPYLRG